MAVVERYGSFFNFSELFGVPQMAHYCNAPRRCVTGSAPSLAAVKNAFGENMAVLWLKAFVIDFNANAVLDSEKRMSDWQIQSWAEMALSEWGYLKVTEWMLFFHKAKAAAFGNLYASVNPTRLSEMVREFVYGEYRARFKREAKEEADRLERERERKQREAQGGTITYQEYLKRKQEEDGKSDNNDDRSKIRRPRTVDGDA